MLSTKQKSEIVDTIVRISAPRTVILFGSEASGKATNESDIDIAVMLL